MSGVCSRIHAAIHGEICSRVGGFRTRDERCLRGRVGHKPRRNGTLAHCRADHDDATTLIQLPERRCADCRSSPRLQKIEPVSDPQAFAFEIGRTGRSCFKEGPINAAGQGNCREMLSDVATFGFLGSLGGD